jgi:hypothetical protein
LWSPWWSTGTIVIFLAKMIPWWPSWISNFHQILPRHRFTYTNPYAKFQKNPSTLATCRARTRKVYGRTGETMTKP